MKIKFDERGRKGVIWEVSDSSKITQGNQICKNVHNLSDVKWELGNLKNGYQMFLNCKNLTNFQSDLVSLKSGFQMFDGCSLNFDSIKYISDTINDVSTNTDWENIESSMRGVLHIGCEDLNDEQIKQLGEKFFEKGWRVYFNNKLYISESLNEKYVPDASKWNIEVFTPNSLTITSVIDENVYNEDELICSLGTSRMIDTSSLMKNNSYLKTWKSDLDCVETANGMFDGCLELDTFVVKKMTHLKSAISMFKNCNKLSSFNYDLNSLVDATNMFYNCDSLENFQSSLNSLTIAKDMFGGCSSIKNVSVSLQSLVDGEKLFSKLMTLINFDGDLCSLKNGNEMFEGCFQLESFNSNLMSLEKYDKMFYGCSSIKHFNSDLTSVIDLNEMFETDVDFDTFTSSIPSLTITPKVFYNKKGLQRFDADMSNLTEGCWVKNESKVGMFEGCYKLESFNGDLHNLRDGTNMFKNCKKLTSFRGNLRKLQTATDMFKNCQLDAESVKNIVESLKENTNTGSIELYADSFLQDEVEEILNIDESKAGDLVLTVGKWQVTIIYV